MIVMPANSTNELVHLWAGRWPGSIGHLYTPERRERIRPWLPYALDNGRFADVAHKRDFDPARFLAHLERYAWLEQRPLWIVVPDVPFDGTATLAWWDEWEPKLRDYRLPLALAVQDGICAKEVRSRLAPGDVVFVGGTTTWKWGTAESWCRDFPRVHVGRVNSPVRLRHLRSWGCESCDGSGWFRGKSPQVVGLAECLAAWHHGADDPMFAYHRAVKEAKSTRFHDGFSVQTVITEAA